MKNRRLHRDVAWTRQRDTEIKELDNTIRSKIKGIKEQLKLIKDDEEMRQKKARLKELREMLK